MDALGNEIKKGGLYGYSRNSNGITLIKIGRVTKFNEKTVSMKVLISKKAIYSDDPEDTDEVGAVNIAVKGNLIFPIDDKLINNKEHYDTKRLESLRSSFRESTKRS